MLKAKLSSIPITDKNGHTIEEVGCRRPTIGDSIANEENFDILPSFRSR